MKRELLGPRVSPVYGVVAFGVAIGLAVVMVAFLLFIMIRSFS